MLKVLVYTYQNDQTKINKLRIIDKRMMICCIAADVVFGVNCFQMNLISMQIVTSPYLTCSYNLKSKSTKIV